MLRAVRRALPANSIHISQEKISPSHSFVLIPAFYRATTSVRPVDGVGKCEADVLQHFSLSESSQILCPHSLSMLHWPDIEAEATFAA